MIIKIIFTRKVLHLASLTEACDISEMAYSVTQTPSIDSHTLPGCKLANSKLGRWFSLKCANICSYCNDKLKLRDSKASTECNFEVGEN